MNYEQSNNTSETQNPTKDWDEFQRQNLCIHQMYLELCTLENEYLLYKNIINYSTKYLGIDRIGILLIDHEKFDMLGTYGIDEHGQLTEYKNFRKKIPDASWVQKSLHAQDYIFVNYDAELEEGHKVHGRGWNSMAAFWDKNKPIGWIACDNLLSHQPLPFWKKEILGQLSRIVGQLVMRLRSESKLRGINNNLNNLVIERTKSLETKSDQLEAKNKDLIELQDKLIQSEKHASLGQLIAGIAHELNTPIGNALTVSTALNNQSDKLMNQFEANELKRSSLIQYCDFVTESSELIYTSLNHAASLISSFKQISVDQRSDDFREFELKDLVADLIKTLSTPMRPLNLLIHCDIESDIKEIYSKPSAFIQIFTNLINNSLTHAFSKSDNTKNAIIIKIFRKNKEDLHIHFEDNGNGITDLIASKIFDPFFTTRRGSGGTGLGLHIIFNLMHQTFNGSINVESKLNKFTRFELIFPKLLK